MDDLQESQSQKKVFETMFGPRGSEQSPLGSLHDQALPGNLDPNAPHRVRPKHDHHRDAGRAGSRP